MTGSGKVSIMRKMSLPFLPKASPPCASMPDIAAISAPATKDFSPAPVTITQRTVSVSMPSKVAFKSSSTSAFSAFSAFSRSMVTTATAPLVSYFTYPICLASSEKSTEGLRACEDPPITLSCTAQQSLRSPGRRRCRASQDLSWHSYASSHRAASQECGSRKRQSGGRAQLRHRLH